MIKYLELNNGCKCYVSDDGKIFNKNMKEYTHRVDNAGYHSVQLQNSKGNATINLVHRLVVQAFVNKDITKFDQIHHIDEDKGNNNLSNLKIMSIAEHQALHKTIYPKTKKCIVCGNDFTPAPTKRKRNKVCSEKCQSILVQQKADERNISIDQYTLDGIFIKTWDSGRDVMNELGFAESNINKCCNHKIRSAYGYKWEYHDKDKRDVVLPYEQKYRKLHQVEMFDLDGNYIKTFDNSTEASKYIGKGKSGRTTITSCCTGNNKTAYGYKWAFGDWVEKPI